MSFKSSALGILVLFGMASTVAGAPADHPCFVPGPTVVPQVVDTFDWPFCPPPPPDPSPHDLRCRGHLAAERRKIGDGREFHDVTIQDGVARFVATQGSRGTSWAGITYSFAGLDGEAHRTLDPLRILPPPILDHAQAQVRSWRLRVKGNGPLKVENRLASGALCREWVYSVNSPDYITLGDAFPTDCGPVKRLSLVADSPADLVVEELELETQVPALTPLHYAFLMSYAQLLRAYDDTTGHARDKSHLPLGEFDSVPAMGFVALASAAAADVGIISNDAARSIATRAIDALLAAPRCHGWLPHWLRGNQPHENSEWSTVDTALAVLSAIQAANELGLQQQLQGLRSLVAALDFPAVTDSDGRIHHGLDRDATGCTSRQLDSAWGDWGGETAMVELLRAYHDPSLPPIPANRQPPAYCGRGFITEMGALSFPQLGAPGYGRDRYNVDWHAERVTHHAQQRAFAGNQPIYGASPMEVRSPIGVTAYLEAGTGTPTCPPVDTLPGFDGPWRAPHYMGMASSLDRAHSCTAINHLRDQGLMPPLGGPSESVLVNRADGQVRGWHSVQVSLNAFFNAMGYYHALARAEGRRDVVHATVCQGDPRLSAAIEVLVSGACASPGGALHFYTVPPCRVVDTRNTDAPALQASRPRAFPIAGRCSIPDTARGVAYNVTVVRATDVGNVRLWPAGEAIPQASAINFKADHTRANNGVIKLGRSGEIGVLADLFGGTGSLHVVIDVTGYFF